MVRWTHYLLLSAEEFGITQANVAQMAANDPRPEVQRILGKNGELGKMLGLDNLWAVNVIKAVGNYGEIFARNLTPIGIQRGPNALWTTRAGCSTRRPSAEPTGAGRRHPAPPCLSLTAWTRRRAACPRPP